MLIRFLVLHATYATQKMRFSIKDFFRKCDQIRRELRIWSHLLKKCLIENFIFFSVFVTEIWSILTLWEGFLIITQNNEAIVFQGFQHSCQLSCLLVACYWRYKPYIAAKARFHRNFLNFFYDAQCFILIWLFKINIKIFS